MESVKDGKDINWSPDLDLMDYDYEFRVKPSKEKRWIATRGDHVFFVFDVDDMDIWKEDGWELQQIEVEV